MYDAISQPSLVHPPRPIHLLCRSVIHNPSISAFFQLQLPVQSAIISPAKLLRWVKARIVDVMQWSLATSTNTTITLGIPVVWTLKVIDYYVCHVNRRGIDSSVHISNRVMSDRRWIYLPPLLLDVLADFNRLPKPSVKENKTRFSPSSTTW